MPPTTRRVWQHGSVSKGTHDEIEQAGVLVAPGDGVLSRRGSALLFLPDAPDEATLSIVERLVTDLRHGSEIDDDDRRTRLAEHIIEAGMLADIDAAGD